MRDVLALVAKGLALAALWGAFVLAGVVGGILGIVAFVCGAVLLALVLEAEARGRPIRALRRRLRRSPLVLPDNGPPPRH